MTTNTIKEQIQTLISTIHVPHLNLLLGELNAVKNIEIQNNSVLITLLFGYPVASIKEPLTQAICEALNPLKMANQIDEIHVAINFKVHVHPVQQQLQRLPKVKNIIAVASGKGGVGKSTTTVNLALALAQEGAKVGILDGDIYGPNQPHMLGLSGRPEKSAEDKLIPLEAHGIQSMSIGYLIEQTDTPMIWRGPMVSSALKELLNDTAWDDLDYLFIDLPPGTGDIQLTMAQKIPVAAAVIVTTPQDIALLDARKAFRMFEKLDVSVLGVVENMSVHVCTQCGHKEHIFGEGGADSMVKQYGIQSLGALPLNITIRQNADGGCPSVVADPEGEIATTYREIAYKIARNLSLRPKKVPTKFPKIVVENK